MQQAELIINPKFRDLIDPLENDEINVLREDLRQHGCLVPIMAWKGMIVDGHTRYRLCREMNVPFNVQEVSFEDEDAVKIWILTNQVGRRNLEKFRRYELLHERDKLAKLRSERLKRRLKNLELSSRRNGEAIDESSGKEVPKLGISFIAVRDISDEKDNTPLNNQKEIAKELGVGTGTVSRMQYIRKKADEDSVADEVLKQLRTGKVSVNKVYSDIKKKEKSIDAPAGTSPSPPAADPVSKATNGRFTAPKLAKYLMEVSMNLSVLEWKDIQTVEPLEMRDKISNQLQVMKTHIERIFKTVMGD